MIKWNMFILLFHSNMFKTLAGCLHVPYHRFIYNADCKIDYRICLNRLSGRVCANWFRLSASQVNKWKLIRNIIDLCVFTYHVWDTFIDCILVLDAFFRLLTDKDADNVDHLIGASVAGHAHLEYPPITQQPLILYVI